jgi:hypothetical protein
MKWIRLVASALIAYGLNADLLWSTIEPTLRTIPVPPGSYAVKRYGGPGAPETQVSMPLAVQQ